MEKLIKIDISKIRSTQVIAASLILLLIPLLPINLAAASIPASNKTTTIQEQMTTNSSGIGSSISCCLPVLLAPIAISDNNTNNVYVVWPSNKTGDFEIMFRASTDGGHTFGEKINLSRSVGVNSIDPQLAANGNKLYVTWWEFYGNGTREPFFIASEDNGLSFHNAIRLSNTPANNTANSPE